MNYTLKINKVENEGKTKAFVSMKIDEEFVVNNIKIVEGANGLFVAMPNYKNSKEEYVDICHPIKKEFRKELYDKILEEYQNS